MEKRSFWRDLIYLLIAKMLWRKVVYQVHGGEMPDRFLGENAISHSFLRCVLSMPDAIVLLARTELSEYASFGVRNRMLVIPNAIRLEDYSDFEPREFRNNNLVLGYIGRLADDKGIAEAIEALDILQQHSSNHLTLKIAGSGPYEPALRAISDRPSTKARVEFMGALFGADKLRFWKEIDIFVFPTFHREGLPYTILEAMASGTPIITTRVGGIPDVIQNGVQGVLLDSHTPQAVAEAINRLASDRKALREMSKAAVQRARDAYSVERLADQFGSLYRELLA
jgi:glycosyltransferase involved in cell wall biosynthesis